MDSSKQHCPKGHPIPKDAPDGQCPQCLMDLADFGAMAEVLPRDLPGYQHRQFGDFLLLKQIGQGGMGEVYEARQVSLGRLVAVKLIKDSLLASPDLQRQFYLEAEACARLQHPNIVKIFTVDENEGQPYISMELIEGDRLADQIARGEFRSKTGANDDWEKKQTSIAALMAKVAQAVNHAHQHQVLHRDLKPANVLVDHSGEPHLVDFGLAKILEEQPGGEDLSDTGDIMGTVPYMAPEQAKGKATSKATDIHGLGAILYALLTSRPPFFGSTPGETLKMVEEQPPTRPRAINPSVDKDLEIICLKCLEKHPLRRYGTAEEVGDDLSRWLKGQPIKARRAGYARRTYRWIRRNPVGSALIASLLVGLGLSLSTLEVARQRDQERERVCFNVQVDVMDRIMNLGLVEESRQAGRDYLKITYREMDAYEAYKHSVRPFATVRVEHELNFGENVDFSPLSLAQERMKFLRPLAQSLESSLQEPCPFNLILYADREVQIGDFARGKEVDVMLIDPVVYLEAKALQKDLKVIAQYRQHEHGYLFTHVNSGITNIKQLKGRSLVFPDPYHACSITAKALLVDAGITARDLLAFTNVTDTGIKWTRDRTTRPIVSYRETVVLVSSNQYEAGLTLDRRYVQLHPKLQSLLTFDDFPKIVAVRAGLENRIVVALRQSLLETGQFVLIGDANLEPLKEKMEKAERFEPAPKASAASLNSNSGRALPPPVPAP